MGAGGELLVGAAMLVGVAGVLVPVLPGLLLVWLAALVWALLEGDGPGRWWVLALVTAVCLAGTAAKYVLPGRTLREAGAPRRTVAVGAVGAAVGFVVLPVVGALVGALLGVLAAEAARLGDLHAAWRSTWATARGVGIGVLLELVAAVLAVAVWVVGVLLTA